jgi:hypothetical protein
VTNLNLNRRGAPGSGCQASNVVQKIMNHEFRKTHLIQAALQQRGVPIATIHTFLEWLAASVRSTQEFEKWNEKLDDDGIKMLTIMLSKGGADFCDACLEALFESITAIHGIPRAELVARARLN